MNIKNGLRFTAAFSLVVMSLAGMVKSSSASDIPYILVVNLPSSQFEVGGWPTGVEVNATVDPGTPGVTSDDYHDTQVTSAGCGHPACATFQITADLQPSWTITVTDGTITSHFTLPDVRVALVDLETDIISGTIQPPLTSDSSLWAGFFFPPFPLPPYGDCPFEGVLTYDALGNWAIDISQCDIVYGSWGALNYFAEDGSLIGSWHAPSRTIKGFYQPVDMDGVFNVVKNGSTVPLKFEIFEGTSELTDVSEIESFSFEEVPCEIRAVTDAIETTVNSGSSLRYDSLAGQFIYNWKTPKTPGKCYLAIVATIDYQWLGAYFKLK